MCHAVRAFLVVVAAGIDLLGNGFAAESWSNSDSKRGAGCDELARKPDHQDDVESFGGDGGADIHEQR